jgi:hypothetical protein
MNGLGVLARILGIKPDLAEDALHSERAARAVLTRRNLFAAGGALAAGSVFSFGAPARVPLTLTHFVHDQWIVYGTATAADLRRLAVAMMDAFHEEHPELVAWFKKSAPTTDYPAASPVIDPLSAAGKPG